MLLPSKYAPYIFILNCKNNTNTFEAKLHNIFELPEASNINKVDITIERDENKTAKVFNYRKSLG